MVYAQDDQYGLWETYAQYFRHIVTNFDARDVDEAQLGDVGKIELKRTLDDVDEDFDRFDRRRIGNAHRMRLSLLRELDS